MARTVMSLVMWWKAVTLGMLLCGGANRVVGTVGTVGSAWGDTAVFYRLLVDSFKDSDGDGLGDLMGATKQLSYVRALGADAVILSPLCARSTDCARPGLIHLTDLDQRYGTLAALTTFVEKASKLELKVVMAVPMQTISTASSWFDASANRTAGYEDWLLWRDGKANDPPPVESDVSWVWHEGRSSFWASANNESLLNFCSESVSAALAAAQCAWLRRGLAGVLLTPDNPNDQSCAEKLVRKLAAEAASCARASNLETPLVMVESSLSPEKAARYYTEGSVGACHVISTAMTTSEKRTAPELALSIHATLLYAPPDGAPTWMTSSSTGSRLAKRFGNEMVDAFNLLALVLPGAAVIIQGDELGAADTIMEWSSTTETCWPREPVPHAAPMSWDATANAGFTTSEPWLPLAPNYRYANAKTEFNKEGSHVGVVRVAAAMRKSPAIGPHLEITRLGHVLAVLRWGGTGSLLLVSNLGKDTTEARLSVVPGLPAEMTVAVSSGGSGVAPGSHVTLDKVMKLAPGETVLLAGAPRHCGGPGPVDKIATKLTEGWQKLNKYFGNK